MAERDTDQIKKKMRKRRFIHAHVSVRPSIYPSKPLPQTMNKLDELEKGID